MPKGGEGTAPEGWVQCGSHPAALPSAAPEVENALSLQKSQDVLDVEEEKKMAVREQLAVCDIRGGKGADVPSPPTDEAGVGCNGQRTVEAQTLGLESRLHL